MGIKIRLDLNIPGKYLLVLALLFLISSFLFMPWSPIHDILEFSTDKYVSPDSSEFTGSYYVVTDDSFENATFDKNIDTGLRFNGGETFTAYWNFTKPTNISSVKIRASSLTTTSIVINGQVFEALIKLDWGDDAEEKEFVFAPSMVSSVAIIFSSDGDTALPTIYEAEFLGEQVLCYTCKQTEDKSALITVNYYGSCPDGWYRQSEVPPGYCFSEPVPDEEEVKNEYPLLSIIFFILAVCLMFIVFVKR